MTRRLAILPLLVVAVLAAGCNAVISGHGATQTATGAPVRIVTDLCAADSSGDVYGACHDDTRFWIAGRLLAAYEVPEGTEVVDVDLAGPDFGALTMTRSSTLEDHLDATQPPAAGREWVGLQSEQFAWNDGDPAGAPYALTARLETLLDPPDGATTAPYETYIALRGGSGLPAEPVDCSGSKCTQLGLAQGVASDVLAKQLALRDVTVEPGAPVTVEPNQTASVPFTARYIGSGASETFPVGVTSTVGKPSLDVASLAFAAAGTKTVTVSVPVPDGTPVGPRDVTLTMELPNGEMRRATGRIDVKARPAPPEELKESAPLAPPAPSAPPAATQQRVSPPAPGLATIQTGLRSLKLRSARRGAALRSGLRFTQDFVLPGRATWELRRKG